jgi:hypothetical protein
MKKKWLTLLLAAASLIALSSCSKGRGLPDLGLSEVGCQDGLLYFKVMNNGQGDIPNKNWESLASVAIDGIQQGDVLLSKPTSRTNGGAEKAGGTSTYLTEYPVYNIIRVDIALDYNDAIEESHNDDNVRNSLYVAPCDLPDLTVEGLSLDKDCCLVIRLKNVGKGPVPQKAWHFEFMDYCAVSIYSGDKQIACSPLVAIDPDHALEPPGGVLVFKTDLKIKNKTLITVIIDSTANVSETNKQNNKASATLGCQKS